MLSTALIVCIIGGILFAVGYYAEGNNKWPGWISTLGKDAFWVGLLAWLIVK